MVKKYTALKDMVGSQKRIGKLVTICKGCTLTFKQRLIYSTLVYRGGSGRSQRWLSSALYMDAARTVRPALLALSDMGLVRRDGKLWLALEPPSSDMGFSFGEKGESWAERFNYQWTLFPSPSCPFSVLECCILAQHILKVRPAFIKARLGVSGSTVNRVKRKYLALGNRIDPTWFQDKGKVVRAGVVKPVKSAEMDYAAEITPFLDDSARKLVGKLSALMLSAGYKPAHVKDVWLACRRELGQDADKWDRWLWSFREKFATIEARNADRNKNHKGEYRTSFELFKYSLPTTLKNF